MDALLNALIRPRTIAVIGASPKRQTLGNVALDNLANYKFAGKVIPVHGEAPEIAGLAAVPAIEALPEDLRTAIVLRELEGLSYEEIAAAMDCPVGTVRSRIFRAREAIDRQLREVFEGGLGRAEELG